MLKENVTERQIHLNKANSGRNVVKMLAYVNLSDRMNKIYTLSASTGFLLKKPLKPNSFVKIKTRNMHIQMARITSHAPHEIKDEPQEKKIVSS